MSSELPGDALDISKREEAVAGTVQKWLGNPISRALLRVVTGRTKQGNRLDLVLRSYIGEEIPKDLDLRSKLASFLVGFPIERGAEAFGVNPEKMKETLRDPIIRRGIANVLEGIAENGIQRPFTSVAPFLVVWNYTRLCNLRCKHCYENASPDADTSDELSTEEAKEFIDEFKRAGGAAIAFSGGEPLMRDDFFEVSNYAKEQNFFVSIASNGTLITKEMAEKLSETIDYAEISLDGFEETHDKFRGIEGSWKRTCRGIRNAVEAGIDTCVALTATHYNLDEIPDLIKFAEEGLGAKKAIIFNFIPVRKGEEIIDQDLTPDERWELLEDIYFKLLDENNSMTLFSTAPQYAAVSWEFAHGPAIATHFTNQAAREALQGETETLAQFIGGCGAGRLYCALEPNGDVEPCVFIPIRIGNIRNQKLRDIWKNSEVLDEIRNRDEFEGCKDCDYKYICGGCRARAYGYYGDLQGPDPSCPENEKYWKELEDKT